ncbi:MAG: hypothetical protein R2882_08970 [Gemmatimonadales bacterium]
MEVITRVLRTASWGTEPPPKLRPSSVMLLAVGARPPTEKPAAVESVPESVTTPGTSVASISRSLASIGSRCT